MGVNPKLKPREPPGAPAWRGLPPGQNASATQTIATTANQSQGLGPGGRRWGLTSRSRCWPCRFFVMGG
jgi:hypothetical protein